MRPGTFRAAGCVSFRAGAFDAVGDRNPVTERARRPRLERNVPARAGCPRRRVPSSVSEGTQQQILLDVGQRLDPVSASSKSDPGQDRPQNQTGPGVRIQIGSTLASFPSPAPNLLQMRASGGEELTEKQLPELLVLGQLAQKRQHRPTCGP